MESIVDALPGQPLTAENVEALNDAASVRLIPYSWSGTQVVILLIDDGGTIDGGRFEPPAAATETTAGSFERTDGADSETGESAGSEPTSSSDLETAQPQGFATVEVVEASQVPEDNPFADLISGEYASGSATASQQAATTASTERDADAESRSDETTVASDDGAVLAVGYDPDSTTWVRIGEVDSGTTLADVEPFVREWLEDTYHEQMLDRLAVGPSEYELPG